MFVIHFVTVQCQAQYGLKEFSILDGFWKKNR